MSSILNRPATLLVIPKPLSFSCPKLDFETLLEAADFATERVATAYLVWAQTPDGRNVSRERLARIHRASRRRSA
jgi:hypothetical protein